MDKKNITLILLLSALAILLLSLQNPEFSNLFLYVALGISVLAAEITFLPEEVLLKRLQVPNIKKILSLGSVFIFFSKKFLYLALFVLDQLGALTKFIVSKLIKLLSWLSRRTLSVIKKTSSYIRKSFQLLTKSFSDKIRRAKQARKEKVFKKASTAKIESHQDEETWPQLIAWWIKTPILPSSFSEWLLCIIFVVIVTLYIYIVLDRFFAGHNELDMFAIWMDV